MAKKSLFQNLIRMFEKEEPKPLPPTLVKEIEEKNYGKFFSLNGGSMVNIYGDIDIVNFLKDFKSTGIMYILDNIGCYKTVFNSENIIIIQMLYFLESWKRLYDNGLFLISSDKYIAIHKDTKTAVIHYANTLEVEQIRKKIAISLLK